MNAGPCPNEAELLAWADKVEGTESLDAHVETCGTCRQQVADLRQSITQLRQRVVSPPSASQETSSTPRPPGSIGKCLVVGRLSGRQSFQSFRALHPLLHIDLRIDVVLEPVPNRAEYREPIATEVRRLMSIEDEHLSRIRDSGFFEDRPYVVADYGPDKRLDQRLLEEPLEPDAAAGLVATLARAAIPIAEAGVLPREINPTGILLRDGSGPLWTDWGAACLLRAPSSDGANLSLHQLLACLFADLVVPQADLRHDPASAREVVAKLRGAGQVSAATAKALQTALEQPTDSADALADLSRNLSPRAGFWARLFG
jgi:hypothetical protein